MPYDVYMRGRKPARAAAPITPYTHNLIYTMWECIVGKHLGMYETMQLQLNVKQIWHSAVNRLLLNQVENHNDFK